MGEEKERKVERENRLILVASPTGRPNEYSLKGLEHESLDNRGGDILRIDEREEVVHMPIYQGSANPNFPVEIEFSGLVRNLRKKLLFEIICYILLETGLLQNYWRAPGSELHLKVNLAIGMIHMI